MTAIEHSRASARTGSIGPPGTVAARLARISRRLEAQDDPESVLPLVVEAAVGEVPGAEAAGVSLFERRHRSASAASDPLAAQVEAVQARVGQGPGVSVAGADGAPPVRADELDSDSRWPDFAPAAAALGVRSALAFPIAVDGAVRGALSVYARRPHAFPADAERVGVPLATHAGLAVAAARSKANFRCALDSRDLIGQAKGILMERYRIGSDEAFALLVASSQGTHAKLRDVAERLTLTGELPVPPQRRGSG